MTYPIEDITSQVAVDGLNYLLSGPSGLGQDFQGFSSFSPAWLTGNFRLPYTTRGVLATASGSSGAYTVTVSTSVADIQIGMTVSGPEIGAAATVTAITGNTITLSVANTGDLYGYQIEFTPAVIPSLYVPAIALSSSTWLDPYTWRFDFASTQASAPFVPGNIISVSGVSPGDYDGDYSPIGVVECTTSYVIARTRQGYTDPGPGSGGSVTVYNTTNYPSEFNVSTDCNLKVTVTGPTEQVFISSQLVATLNYIATASSDLLYTVSINRYVGAPNEDPVNPGFFFEFQERVSQRQYSFTGLNGTGALAPQETIFSTFVDTGIPAGYYWYILDVSFQRTSGDIEVTQVELAQRSLTTQVVKA